MVILWKGWTNNSGDVIFLGVIDFHLLISTEEKLVISEDVTSLGLLYLDKHQDIIDLTFMEKYF